jgi:hypothetical protein
MAEQSLPKRLRRCGEWKENEAFVGGEVRHADHRRYSQPQNCRLPNCPRGLSAPLKLLFGGAIAKHDAAQGRFAQRAGPGGANRPADPRNAQLYFTDLTHAGIANGAQLFNGHALSGLVA